MLIKKTLLNGAKDCWELWRVSSAWLYLSCLDNSNVLFATAVCVNEAIVLCVLTITMSAPHSSAGTGQLTPAFANIFR